MKLQILLALLLLFITAPCFSGGIEDFQTADDLWRANIYDEAIRYYKSAIVSEELSEQELVKAYYNIAADLFIRYQPYDVIAIVNKILMLQPEHIGAYSLRAEAYVLLGKDQMALSDWDKILDLDSTDFLTYYNRAHFYADRNQFDKAIFDIDTCLLLKGMIPEQIEDLIKLKTKLGKSKDP